MRAMRAESFTGYGGLKLVDLPKPVVADGRVLVRITAAGVTPLDHTILSGGYPRATAPLVLGNEGAGVVHDPGDSAFSVGARVMFTGPYGVFENGTYAEWIAVRSEHLCPIPAKAEQARALGFDDVIDLSAESLADGVARITGGRGVDVVIESVGGALTGQALATLAPHGVLTSLGYSAGRKTTIDVTDLIWKRASMSGFALAAQSHAIKAAAWDSILPLLTSGQVNPIVERTYKLDDAAEALRHLIEDRPFGRVVLVG